MLRTSRARSTGNTSTADDVKPPPDATEPEVSVLYWTFWWFFGSASIAAKAVDEIGDRPVASLGTSTSTLKPESAMRFASTV